MATKRGKTWQAFISYYTPSGERIRERKGGFRTKSEAVAYEVDRMNEIKQGGLNEGNILFPEYYDRWLESHFKQKLKSQTIANHLSTQKIIHKYFKNSYLKDINRKEIQNFVNDFSETHQASTTKQTLIRVSMPLKEAFNDGIIPTNPTTNIKIPNIKNEIKKINYLESDDMNTLINYLEMNDLTPQRFSIYISILSGMRLGEILALTYDSIDSNSQTISVTQNKTNRYPFEYVTPKTLSSNRTIYMPERFFIQLARYKKENPNTDIHFLGENHEQNYYTHELKKLIKELNLEEITFHGLRHTHASYLINNGVDVAYVSERLGHSNIAITQRTYFHLLNDKRESEKTKTMSLFN